MLHWPVGVGLSDIATAPTLVQNIFVHISHPRVYVFLKAQWHEAIDVNLVILL